MAIIESCPVCEMRSHQRQWPFGAGVLAVCQAGIIRCRRDRNGPRGDGAGNRIRTYDPRITNALLYQLSYPGAGGGEFYRLAVLPSPGGRPPKQCQDRSFGPAPWTQEAFLRSRMTRSIPATSVPGGAGGKRLNSTSGTGTSIRAPLEVS